MPSCEYKEKVLPVGESNEASTTSGDASLMPEDMEVLSLDKAEPAPGPILFPFFKNGFDTLGSLVVLSGVRGATELFLKEADLGVFSCSLKKLVPALVLLLRGTLIGCVWVFALLIPVDGFVFSFLMSELGTELLEERQAGALEEGLRTAAPPEIRGMEDGIVLEYVCILELTLFREPSLDCKSSSSSLASMELGVCCQIERKIN